MPSAFTYMYLQKWTANVFYDMNRIMRKKGLFWYMQKKNRGPDQQFTCVWPGQKL